MKLTPWFSGCHEPARSGVYEREFPHAVLYSKWNGKEWKTGAFKPSTARRRSVRSLQQHSIRWRGLAEKPE